MPTEPPSPSGFDSLYQRTLQPLRRLLTRYLGDSAEAQDVAHDAYLRVYPLMEKNEARRPDALLFTTARRLAINRIKRRQNGPIAGVTNHSETVASPAPDVVRQVMARQELDRLQQAIDSLPAGCRSVLLLRKFELLSHQEIADRLGIAVSTVEKQHARALRLLRTALTAEEPIHPHSEART